MREVGISSYCLLQPTLVLSSQPAHPLPGAWKTQPANWWPQHPACSQRACSGPWEDQGVDHGAGLVISASFSYWLQLFLAPVSPLGTWIQGLKDFGRAKLILNNELGDDFNPSQNLHFWGLPSWVNLFKCIILIKLTTHYEGVVIIINSPTSQISKLKLRELNKFTAFQSSVMMEMAYKPRSKCFLGSCPQKE